MGFKILQVASCFLGLNAHGANCTIGTWTCKSQENTGGTCKSQENSGGYLRSGDDLKKLENLSSCREVHMYDIIPCIQICATKPVLSLWNFLSDIIYSKSVVFFLKHVQCSRIRLNGGVSFITFRVHVYKIL